MKSILGAGILAIYILTTGLNEVCAQSVKDIDGNIYQTVQVGNQVWLKGNLKTTRLNNGRGISETASSWDWENTNSAAYCWYENDPSNKNKYGAIYNWYAIETGALCPSGWHVPSDQEWEYAELIAGGYRNFDGEFFYVKNYCAWWTATETSSRNAIYRSSWWDGTSKERDEVTKKDGFYVRCVKN